VSGSFSAANVSTSNLGIPDGYGFCIESAGVIRGDCTPHPLIDQNLQIIRRAITSSVATPVVVPGTISPNADGDFKITVWKT
jgi:hypothetical protein